MLQLSQIKHKTQFAAQSYLKKVILVLCNGEMSYISYGLIFFKESHKLVKDTINLCNHVFSLFAIELL